LIHGFPSIEFEDQQTLKTNSDDAYLMTVVTFIDITRHIALKTSQDVKLVPTLGPVLLLGSVSVQCAQFRADFLEYSPIKLPSIFSLTFSKASESTRMRIP